MKILYLSDFNCPYSYIGLNRMKNVCNELNLNVEWELKSFELDFASLVTDGLLFLWVTGRVLDLARERMKAWGFRVVDEIVLSHHLTLISKLFQFN